MSSNVSKKSFKASQNAALFGKINFNYTQIEAKCY